MCLPFESVALLFSGSAPGMSLFPVVSQVDAVDANYLTIKTAEGFLVHYHDLQRMQEPGASPTSSHPRARDRREPRPDRLIGCRQLRFQPPRETRVRGPKEKRKTKTVLFLRAARRAIAFASFPRRASHPKHPRTALFLTPLSTARTSQPLTTWTAGTTPRRPRGTRLCVRRTAWRRFGPPPRACCPTPRAGSSPTSAASRKTGRA